MFRTEWRAWRTIDAEPPVWLRRELIRCCAKIVALSANSDLWFVGRSLESAFDFLSGLLSETSWSERLSLVHFSMSKITENEVVQRYPGAIEGIRRYLAYLGLEPNKLGRRERPIAFVDIVATGETLGNLVKLTHSWCVEADCDWQAARRKIRVIGLPERTESSPRTWRWQQHTQWVSLLESNAVKNISIPAGLFEYFGAAQSKVSVSYPPWRWGDRTVKEPRYDHETLMALRMAVSLFDEGRQRASKELFVRELSEQSAMRHSWFRGLIQELKT
jgi:hypothetical protein